MHFPETLFRIIDQNLAIGALPSDRTLRVAKAMGFGSVLHVSSPERDSGSGRNKALELRVLDARLCFGEWRIPAAQKITDDNVAAITGKLAQLPQPVLIVAHDPQTVWARIFGYENRSKSLQAA